MNFYDKWFEQLMNQTSAKWENNIESNGLCKLISGPKAFYAEVFLSFSSSNRFEVENLLETSVKDRALEEGWIDFIIYGVIDVFSIYSSHPIKDFKLVIHEIKYNEIDSVPFAFRIASRDAALKALKKYFPNMRLVN